jgi:hypothetical protein
MGRVAFLAVEVYIFQILRNRIVDSLPFLTLSAEASAPPLGVERDALARGYIHARLLTRCIVGDLAFVHHFLALRHVAFLVVPATAGAGGGSLEVFQSLRMRIVGSPRFLTLCAEVAAPPTGVERDALAV